MNDHLAVENINKVFELNGIEVYTVKTNKFKTGNINIFFIDNLDKTSVSKNALVPYVLKRGSSKYKDLKEINLKLDELYGSTFECGVLKKGEWQIVQFYIDYVSDIYLNENESMFDEIVEFLFDILLNPFKVNDGFNPAFLEGEKDNIRRKIDNRINDKVHYATERCFEEMCKDEPYSIYEYGIKEDLDIISETDLYSHYKNYFLKKLPIKVFISGEFNDENLEKLTNKLKVLERNEIINLKLPETVKEVKSVKEVTEKLSVNQGKLSIGFRTNISYTDKEYKSLVVYNCILGGGIHSKLFANVREKESLAYYARSRIDKFKSLQLITSGIEIENKEKAFKIIMEQIEDIKNGNISDYEYEATLISLETSYNYLKDTQLSIIDFYLGQILLGCNEKIHEIINNLKTVTRDDVIKVSKKVNLDTVYFLTSRDN